MSYHEHHDGSVNRATDLAGLISTMLVLLIVLAFVIIFVQAPWGTGGTSTPVEQQEQSGGGGVGEGGGADGSATPDSGE